MGGTGLTAYVALSRIAKLQAGEDIFVSAAAGGVGSAIAQLARLMGAGRLIGSTGSAAKARYLTETLDYDFAIDYHSQDLSQALGEAAPEGFDIYIDNVGGKHQEAAIRHIRDHGRIAWVARWANITMRSRPNWRAISTTSWGKACGWRVFWCATTATCKTNWRLLSFPICSRAAAAATDR